MALDRTDRAIWIYDSLTFGCLANQTFSCFCKSDNRRCGSVAAFVRDNDTLSAFHYGYAGVGSA